MSFQCICQCLEFQFDAVISDRAMILHCMHLLANTLTSQPILSWDFFLARFDSLSLEAQIDLEATTGDLTFPTGRGLSVGGWVVMSVCRMGAVDSYLFVLDQLRSKLSQLVCILC